jgi:hypothetical protein
LQNGPSCLLVSGLGLFSLFSLFGFEHYHISYFCGMLKHFGFFRAPSFVWALLIIEDLSAYFLHLPLSVGCDPNQGYFSRKTH